MEIEFTREDDAFKLKSSQFKSPIWVDTCHVGENQSDAPRPMQLFLASLGSCSSIDILNILYKARNRVEDYRISIHGNRVDEVPAVFDRITLHLELRGEIKEKTLQQAIKLTKEKYCSVIRMLKEEIKVEFTYTIIPS